MTRRNWWRDAWESFMSLSRRNDGAREIRSQWDCRQLSNQRELSNSDITQTEDITCWRDAKVLNFDAPMRFLTQRDFQVGIWVRNGMHVGTQLPFGGFCRCFSRRLVASQSARVPAANASVTKTRRTVAAAVMASSSIGGSNGAIGAWSSTGSLRPQTSIAHSSSAGPGRSTQWTKTSRGFVCQPSLLKRDDVVFDIS